MCTPRAPSAAHRTWVGFPHRPATVRHTSARPTPLLRRLWARRGHRKPGPASPPTGPGKRLSERSTAYADAEGLRLVYPTSAEHAQTSELADHVGEAELIGAFEALTDHVFAKRPVAAGQTAAQLSGGMDATNLAISLALAHPGAITPCAMLIGGEAGPQQEARRRAVIEQTGFAADVTVRAADHPVLSPGGLRRSRAEAVSPLDEPHLEAADALAQALRARGIHTVAAGFGGDEVARTRRTAGTPARTPVAPSWCGERVRDLMGEVDSGISPATVAPETALIALEVATPLMARRGLWTVAPFTDADMVRFGHRLPVQWKTDKHLLHRRLAARGLPEDVVNPPLRENFGHLMNTAVHRHATGLLRGWGKELHLIEQGFVDAAVLTEAVERAALSPEDAAPFRTGLYLITAVELALRGNQPPVCARHARTAADLCPHLTRDPMVLLAQGAPLYGVNGVGYGYGSQGVQVVERPAGPIPYGHPLLPTVLASQMVRRLSSFRLVGLDELLWELERAA